MNWFEHLVNGNLAAARMLRNGIQPGDTVVVNTNTSPTPSGECCLKMTVKEVLKNGEFITYENEPYFGYNRFNINDIIK